MQLTIHDIRLVKISREDLFQKISVGLKCQTHPEEHQRQSIKLESYKVSKERNRAQSPLVFLLMTLAIKVTKILLT